MVLYNLLKKLVAGLGKIIPATTKLTLNGVPYTGGSLVAALTGYVTLFDNVAGSKHQYQVAVKQLEAARPGIRQIVAALGSYLRGQLGTGNPELKQLGLKTGSRKRSSLTKRVSAAATGIATKQARGIKGKLQRSKIPAAGPVTVRLYGADGKPIQDSGSEAPSAPAGGGGGANVANGPSGQ